MCNKFVIAGPVSTCFSVILPGFHMHVVRYNGVFVIAGFVMHLSIELHRLQQAVSTLCESLQLLFEDRECCMLLEGKVEMFSQLRSH